MTISNSDAAEGFLLFSNEVKSLTNSTATPDGGKWKPLSRLPVVTLRPTWGSRESAYLT